MDCLQWETKWRLLPIKENEGIHSEHLSSKFKIFQNVSLKIPLYGAKQILAPASSDEGSKPAPAMPVSQNPRALAQGGLFYAFIDDYPGAKHDE